MLEALDLSRRQIRDVAQVKQNCTLLKQRFDIKGWISGSPVDEAWVQERPHAKCLALSSRKMLRQIMLRAAAGNFVIGEVAVASSFTRVPLGALTGINPFVPKERQSL